MVTLRFRFPQGCRRLGSSRQDKGSAGNENRQAGGLAGMKVNGPCGLAQDCRDHRFWIKGDSGELTVFLVPLGKCDHAVDLRVETEVSRWSPWRDGGAD